MTIIGVVTFWGVTCTEKFETGRSWKVLQIRHPRVPKAMAFWTPLVGALVWPQHPSRDPWKDRVFAFYETVHGAVFWPGDDCWNSTGFSWRDSCFMASPYDSGRMSSPTKTKRTRGQGPSFNCSGREPKPPNSQKPSFEKSSKKQNDEEKPNKTETKKKHQEGSQPWWWRQIDLDGKKVSKNGWKSQK